MATAGAGSEASSAGNLPSLASILRRAGDISSISSTSVATAGAGSEASSAGNLPSLASILRRAGDISSILLSSLISYL